MNSLTKMSPEYRNSASTQCIVGLSGKVIRLSFIDPVVFIGMNLLCVIVLHDALVPFNRWRSVVSGTWLAVWVNYSANFYCKITLINRFKLYLMKTYSKTPKTSKT